MTWYKKKKLWVALVVFLCAVASAVGYGVSPEIRVAIIGFIEVLFEAI